MEKKMPSNEFPAAIPLDQRNHNLDLIRIAACFMVIMIHVRSNYTYNSAGEMYPYSAFYLTAIRPCVPLFIMISGFLLLPLRTNLSDFLKRRFIRVCIPVIIWMIIYAFLVYPISLRGWSPVYHFTPVESASYFQHVLYHLYIIPVTFTGETCHFWFLYLILGMYLFMPIISPWIEKASTKMYLYFLAIWSFTLFIPYIKLAGIEQFHGLCDWNLDFHMTYCFAGYLGYLVLGCFLKKVQFQSRARGVLVGFGIFLAGWIFTAIMVLLFASSNKDTVLFELFIGNTTINVAMMTAGLFLIMQHLKIHPVFHGILARLSNLSFGIFIVHWFIAMWLLTWLDQILRANSLFLPPWIGLPFLAVSVFAVSWGICELLNLLPRKLKHYLLG